MKKKDILQLLGFPTSISQKFHEKTCMMPINTVRYDKKRLNEWKKKYYKAYPRLPQISLSLPEQIPSIQYEKVLYLRSSQREYDRGKISKKTVSQLLYYSFGAIGKQNSNSSRRFYPSAGGRYPLEGYIIIRRSYLPSGVFHYQIKNHSLEKLASIKNIQKPLFVNDFANTAPLIILITAVFKRMNIKYGERSYRHTFIEAGHLGQLIYQNAVCLNLSCCALGGYFDKRINTLLGLDILREGVVYAFALGKQKNQTVDI